MPPHLDALLTGPGQTVGIEAKFLETYTIKSGSFADSYFSTPDLWKNLPNARHLALQIRDGEQEFRFLQADQLLKHALGLSKNQHAGFRLALVWYRVEGRVATQVEEEIGRFARAVSSDFDFSAITYQELAADLARLQEPTPGYLDYLADRYQLQPAPRDELPLVLIGNDPTMNRRGGLEDAIRRVDVADLRVAFSRTVAMAPQRPRAGKTYFVGHSGAGDMSNMRSERVLAKAIFNSGGPIEIGGRSIVIIDYEVPLRSQRADSGVGEIDLLGFDAANRRLCIIELKVAPNADTPLKGLLQALRYSAIVDANRHAIERQVEHEFRVADLNWPASVVVAADSAYWDSLRGTPETGDWLAAMRILTSDLESHLNLEIAFADFGELAADAVIGSAQLRSRLVATLI